MPRVRRLEHASSRRSSASPRAPSASAAPRPARRRRRRTRSGLAAIADADLPRLPSGSASSTGSSAAGSSRARSCCVGGEPGIGKSTLLLQAAAGLTRAPAGGSVLYATGEESPGQVRLRAARLGLLAGRRPTASASSPSTTSGGSSRPPGPSGRCLVVVDSIQTATVDELDGRGRQRRPGPRVDPAADGAREGRRDRRHPRRPRDEGRLDRRARRRSSTSSTPSSTSRASGTRRCACCARPRTGSGRPTRSASSRWPRPACSRSPTRPARSSPTTAARRPGSVVAPTLEGSRPLLVEVQALVSPTALRDAVAQGERPRPEPAEPAHRGPRAAGRDRPRAATTSTPTSPAG